MDVENKIRFNLIIGAKTRVHVNSTRLSRSIELLVVWGGVFFFGNRRYQFNDHNMA
jgi:hypothetical protein